ncbi:Bacterial protein of uncharacterised function (DUF882) [Pasteurella bettyae]|nr:Bacterial protein of uncharacterised function (DUF882) [Pasteurella bettyae]
MDPQLFSKLYDIQSNLGLRNTEIQIICGYRCPSTNAKMHRRSRGVAVIVIMLKVKLLISVLMAFPWLK